MTRETLIKYLENNCTDEELDEVIQWFKAGALSSEGKKIAFEDWKEFKEEKNFEDEEKFSLIFDKIQTKINRKSKSATSGFVTWLTRVAAIFLLPVLGFLFYTLIENKKEEVKYADIIEISAPIGSKATVNLSDGSIVHLNYGSKIRYPQFFTGDTREIELTGEGYFDVAHNPDKPFVVKTEELDITAVGTSFNVLAYPGDDEIETTLVNGKVILEQKKEDGTKNNIGSLIPGQHVKYDIKLKTLSSTIGDIEKYIAWKEGKLVFKDAPIIQVAETLSRMFNVEIEVAEEVVDNMLTVTFIDEALFQILDMITIATPNITYEVLSRKEMPDGTFSRQKIKLNKR